ncbi:MAG: HAD family hydrolase [Oscillospiraceae bacterium]|nr:HAD family hydrolase [Oscillospiraceae bacterium]
MSIKAVGFDIGQTLVNYNKPLNWNALYPTALRKVMRDCQIAEQNNRLNLAIAILSKYNTREHYREHEVSSDTIFKEIFDVWEQDYEKLIDAKKSFYGFFQLDAMCFCDTAETLEALSSKNISLGFLTDVAYGMDNVFSLKDIADIKKYFDAGFTSIDVGYRKPNAMGYNMLLESFNITPSQMMYVGDEEKDIRGANNAGIISVLINRSGDQKNWGQRHTIQSLSEMLDIV